MGEHLESCFSTAPIENGAAVEAEREQFCHPECPAAHPDSRRLGESSHLPGWRYWTASLSPEDSDG